MKKLDALTASRFFAALTIVFFHGGGGLFPLSVFPINPLFTSGPVMVSYFFVLSGFVLAYVYHRPGEHFHFGKFAWARFARIYPVYLLAFGLTSLYYIERIARVKPAKIWANLLLVQAWIPKYAMSLNMVAWALSVEAFLYVLFPFLLLWAYRKSLRRLIAVSLGFWVFSQIIHAILMTALIGQDWGSAFLLYNPLFHISTFFVGMVGGIWYLREGRGHKTHPNTVHAVLILGLASAAAGLILLKSPGFVRHFSLANGLFAPFFLVIVLALALERGKIARVLSHRWLVTLGGASYALYLLHVPVRWLYEQALERMGIALPFSTIYFSYLPFVLVLAVVVFLKFEEPVRIWLRRQYRDGNARYVAALLLLDALTVYASVKLSFALRLNFDAEALRFYGAATALALLTAFPARWFLAYAFGLYDRGLASWGLLPLLGRVTGAVLAGSVLIGLILILGEHLALIPGFPRTALLLDALFTLSATLLTRFAAGKIN